MLRRWTESAVVELGLHEVRARRLSFRGKVLAEARGAIGSSQDGIDAAVASFDAVLAEVLAGPSGSRPLAVIVDDAWTYVDVVAGRFGGMTREQIQRIARGCVDEIAPDHEVQWQLQPGGRSLLIAAIPRALLKGLDQSGRRLRVRPCSVKVRAIARWNESRARLAGEDVVFASLGQGFVVCLHARSGTLEGAWQAMIPGGASRASALDLQVDRLLALRGLATSSSRRFVVSGATDVSPRWDVVKETVS